MCMYIEFVLLNNFAVNYLVCYLTVKATGGAIKQRLLIFAAAIGAVFAASYPALKTGGFIIKIVLSAVMCILIATQRTPRGYLRTLLIFYLVSFLFAGGALAVSELWGIGADSGLLPLAVAGGILCAVVIGEWAVKEIYRRSRSERHIYDAELIGQSGRAYRCRAYYDSGNALYGDGKPVAVISPEGCNRAGLIKSGTLAVRTVTGIRNLDLVDLDCRIYYARGRNKIYHTRAVISESLSGREYDILLHRDMGEDND